MPQLSRSVRQNKETVDMNRVVCAGIGVAAVALLTITSSAGTRGPRVTGIYSDMRYIDEAGDVVGTEVFVVYSAEGYYAVIQVAEGKPSVPTVVPMTVDGARVSFSLPGEQGGGLFRGQVTDSSLSGRFADGRAPWDLKRGKSYWQ